jgi:hypothetical protein
MKTTLRILRHSFRLIWEDLWTTLVCNWIWLFANLLILPGPPATMALIYYTNLLAHGETADLKDFWVGFRRYWKTGWKWGLLNLGILFILLGDLTLLRHAEGKLLNQFTAGLYLALLATWLLLQFFALPFLFEQGSLSLVKAFKNGVFIIGRNHSVSISMAAAISLLFIVGTATFMLSFAFGAVLLACASNLTVMSCLEKIEPSRLMAEGDIAI